MTHPVARALLATAAIAVGIALSSCNKDDITPTGRAMAPLSPQMVSLIQSKDMDKGSPILVRVFKQESELEVWKKSRDGRYALLKTYPICRWSGDLGPKKREGDRQAPEGFYTITPGQMNPNSNYYLAFNTGYPNAYDRAWGHTGSELMVHGDCSSRGCYAMTDQQIQEIYALARDAFFGGQREFQFEAFPFHMTALNMARHRNNPNFKFWKMLKQGYDDFEATRQEPKVGVCDRHYVFDAAPASGHSGPLYFNARGKCPAYQLDPQLAPTITAYRRQQEIKMANYIARGVAVATPHVGDGGMNPVFAQELGLSTTAADNEGRYSVANLKLTPGAMAHPPGALPRVPNPPGTTIPKVGLWLAKNKKAAPQPASAPQPPNQPVRVARVPVPTPAPQAKEGQPQPEHQSTSLAGLFGNFFKPKAASPQPPATETANADSSAPVTLRGTNTEMAAAPKHDAAKHTRESKVRTAAAPARHPAHKAAVAKAEPARRHKEVAKAAPARNAQPAWPAAQPRKAPEPEIRTAFSNPPASENSLLSGAQPVMPAGSFDSRWSALR